MSSGANGTFTLTMKPNFQQDLEQRTVTQAIETIRDRVDSLGVSEPVIQEYNLGANQILVELPGISDLDRVKSIIQSTARLEIHPVVGGPFANEQAALQSVGGNLPPDQEILPFLRRHWQPVRRRQFYVRAARGRGGRQRLPLRRSRRPIPIPVQREVRFTLTNEAGEKFYDYTKANVGNPMAVVMGGTVREVANIKSAIHDHGRDRGQLQRGRSRGALQTAAHRRSACFAGGDRDTYGGRFARSRLNQGRRDRGDCRHACRDGLHAYLLPRIGHQRRPGSDPEPASSCLDSWAWLGATLTLPGIAGVILTIGMGVDSNVLIFERIREEIRAGKAASAAVDQGFAHAWITIVDTHVTTIVSAAILFLFGTGPVKGFATTLDVRFAGQPVHGGVRLADHL